MRASILSSTMAFAALGGLAVGCAEPVEDINQVQPHYVSKELFQGDWHYRQTVVDASPLQGIAFIGIEGALEKIRWEIYEDALIGYRTHEAVINLDENEHLPGATAKGDPVVRFPIVEHFDIKRGYSATTGEETNIIGENGSDRPWNEREFMRIDWASGGSIGGGVDLGLVNIVERMDYVRETETFDPDQLQLTEDYISVTQAATVSDGGSTCYYLYGDYNCGTADVSVRLSFAKINPEEEAKFEPRPYVDNVPLYEGNCSLDDVNKYIGRYAEDFPTTREVARKATRGRAVDFANLKTVCTALASESRRLRAEQDAANVPDAEKIGVFQDGDIIRSISFSLRGVGSVEFACTPQFIDALNAVFGRGYFVARDDCGEARYEQYDKFGFFRTERHVWDRRVGGGHDANREYYANNHGVWNGRVSNTFYLDDQDRTIPTNNEGKPVRKEARSYTIETRVPKPLVYYTNVDYPEDLVPTTIRISQDWDAAFSSMAIAATKLDAVKRDWVKAQLDDVASKQLPALKQEQTRLGNERTRLERELESVREDIAEGGDSDRRTQLATRQLGLTDELVEVRRKQRVVETDLKGLDQCPDADGEGESEDHLLEKNLDAGCARFLKKLWVQEQLLAQADGALFLTDDHESLDGYGPEAMYQVRRNTCSIPGVKAYVGRYPEMAEVVSQAIGGGGLDDLAAGNVERACAGLMNVSRKDDDVEEKFAWQQLGDVRYSFVDWVHEQQPAGPLGFGPSSADPENGHIVSGNAHVYGAGVDSYARAASDIIRAMNEDLALNDLISGASYEKWLASDVTVADLEQGVEVGPEQHQAMNRRLGNVDLEQLYGRFTNPDGSIDRSSMIRNMKKRLENPSERDPIFEAANLPEEEGQARLDRIKSDPRFQSMLVDDEMLDIARRLHGWKPGDAETPEMGATAMDLAVDRKALRERMRERFKFFTEGTGTMKGKHGCLYMAEFIDDSVIGAALEMKGLPPEVVYQRLREQIYRGVMLHEIGHTLGMTHNFEASFDALNYQDEFWEIWERFPEEDQQADRFAAKWPEYRYNSIMEYGSRFNSDLSGLGKYDHAAIKFIYGGVVEEFAPEVPVVEDIGYVLFVDGYAAVPEALGGVQNITNRVDKRIEEQVELRRHGVLRNTELFATATADTNLEDLPFWKNREVPFGYCLDTFQGNLTCRVYDEGATHTEVVESAVQLYWNYYAFNAFRRGRNETSFLNGYFSRQDRLGEFLTYPFKYYYFFQNYDVGLRNDLYRASRIGLNFINQVLGTPNPGRHCLDTERNVYLPYGEVDEAMQARCEPGRTSEDGHAMGLDIPVGTGRSQYVDYNDEYYYQVDALGWYFDKLNILQYLTDTSTSFFQVANLGDSRRFSIGFYRLFRQELTKLMHDLTLSVVDGGTGDSFSSLLDDQDRIVPRALIDQAALQQDPDDMAGRPRIHAPMSYNMLWQGLVLMSLYNTSSYDSELDFNEYLTIAEAGTDEDRQYRDDVPVAEFVHPRSQIKYRAAQTIDGNSIGYDLLTRMNRFVEEDWTPAWEAAEGRNATAEDLDHFQTVDHKLGEFMDLVSGVRLLRAAVDTADD